MSNPEIEVVGQLMGNPSKLIECDLKISDFYSSHCKEIYRVILELADEKKAIDPLSVAERLQQETGRDWLMTCAEIESQAFCFSTFANQVAHVRRDGQIKQVRDRLSFYLEEIERKKDLSSADALIQDLMQIRTARSNFDHHIKDSAQAAVERLDELSKNPCVSGIRTGLNALDEAIGGYRPTNLVVIGARPAMGKTAFLINTALAGSLEGHVGFISAEQDHEQLAARMFSIAGNIDSQKIRTGALDEGDWPKLTSVVSRLINKGIHINDQPGIDISTLRRCARDWKYKYDIKALYIDYIQKIKAARNQDNKYLAVGEVVGSLKDLARELKIPVVALAQVKREVDTRPDARPGMADISDSSEIEKEADEVITIYRDEVYNNDPATRGIAELLVCKARHGRTGVVRAHWNGAFMQFKDLSTRGEFQ